MKALKGISAGSILVHVVFLYGAYSILAPVFALARSALARLVG
jgi:hypothetical protein